MREVRPSGSFKLQRGIGTCQTCLGSGMHVYYDRTSGKYRCHRCMDVAYRNRSRKWLARGKRPPKEVAEYQLYGRDAEGMTTHAGPKMIAGAVTQRKIQQLQNEWEQWRNEYVKANPGNYPTAQEAYDPKKKTVDIVVYKVPGKFVGTFKVRSRSLRRPKVQKPKLSR